MNSLVLIILSCDRNGNSFESILSIELSESCETCIIWLYEGIKLLDVLHLSSKTQAIAISCQGYTHNCHKLLRILCNSWQDGLRDFIVLDGIFSGNTLDNLSTFECWSLEGSFSEGFRHFKI